MRVLKFGGSSLATPERVRGVVEIVRRARASGPVAVVVSALGGVTNALLEAAGEAAERRSSYVERLARLAGRHREAAAALAAEGEREALLAACEEAFADLADLLHGVFLLRECSLRTLDSVLSYGERLASRLVAAALAAGGVPAAAHDARRLIVTNDAFGHARVDFEATLPRLAGALAGTLAEALAGALAGEGDVPVVTGFIGATPAGETTTLGRGGSDYTAAIVGAALGAEAVELWTDVDGVMSADPRLVAEAFPLRHLSYAELMELSHFGAKVVHPPSVHPARRHGIPLLIKNTFEPEAPGTVVEEGAPPSPHPIRGIASLHSVALLRLEGDGMAGEPGVAMRLFGALARRGVNVILISQASSEHSICFAVGPEETARARAAVDEEFALERRVGLIQDAVVETGLSVVAVVGDQLRARPGVAGRVFGVLGEREVNVRAIAQGSSELNISLVVDRADEARAVNAIHAAFFTPRRRRVEVAVAGTGRVATAFLEQLRRAAPGLAAREELDLAVVALWNRRALAVAEAGIDLAGWKEAMEVASGAAAADRVVGLLAGRRGAARVFVDLTASDEMAELYRRFLAAGVAVVAANKRPFAGPWASFAGLAAEAARHGAPLRHEATVGAGLPVLSTLSDLLRSGDDLARIDGVLSGTLNFVLGRLAAGEPFSRAVRLAHEQGLTEPHPAEDLSGGDVARKLVILARRAGLALEPETVEVEPLLPAGEDWRGMDLESFWRRLPELDGALAARQARAAEAGERLRHVASLAGARARVAVEAVGPGHPCFEVSGADNLVAFTTARYHASPLVVRGPGAGPEVTAAGVFADLLAAVAAL